MSEPIDPMMFHASDREKTFVPVNSRTTRKTGSADPLLFRRFQLRGLEIRNRLWVAPMCQYQSVAADGPGEGAPSGHAGRLLPHSRGRAPILRDGRGDARGIHITSRYGFPNHTDSVS